MPDQKENRRKGTLAYIKIKEDSETEQDDLTYFYGATTLPDRTREVLSDGKGIDGEILDVRVLEKMADFINDDTKFGGKVGSYRTIGLYHDRVYAQDPTLEEAGYVVAGTAQVEPLPGYPGHYGLKVGTKVNQFYSPSPLYPDHTAEKIQYKIDNGGIGLSMEYNNEPYQEEIVHTKDGVFRYIMDTDDFRGFSYARANVIGNPTAVSIKEIREIIKNKKNPGGKIKMAEQPTETEVKLKEAEQKVQDLTAKLKELEQGDDEAKLKEVKDELAKQKEELTNFKIEQDKTAAKIKESIIMGFEAASKGMKYSQPQATTKVDAKLKEVQDAFNESVKAKEWSKFVEVCDTRVKEQQEHFNKVLKTTNPLP